MIGGVSSFGGGACLWKAGSDCSLRHSLLHTSRWPRKQTAALPLRASCSSDFLYHLIQFILSFLCFLQNVLILKYLVICAEFSLLIRCGVRFRPCIDIHQGKVKQIVGSTLKDLSESNSSSLITNFESGKSAAEYAQIYMEDGLSGGHVIMLDADPLSQSSVLEALHAYPGGLQVGGGINLDNALSYLDEGASHVIVTSFVFSNGIIDLEKLNALVNLTGKKRLVLDLSCREQNGEYYIVTDRWQKFTNMVLDEKNLGFLSTYADEFLVHGVDVEGKKLGIDEELVTLLGRLSPIPVTYAGGVTTMADLERIKWAGNGRVDLTVGSALDIFGGELPYKSVVKWHQMQQEVVC